MGQRGYGHAAKGAALNQRIAANAVALGATLWLASCQTVWGELPDADSIDVTGAEDAPGAVFVDEQRITFSLGDDGRPMATASELRQGVINNERGQWLRLLATPYDKTFTEVVDVVVRTRAPNGTAKTYGREQAVDLPMMPGFVLYSDQRMLLMAPEGVVNGSVVETRAVTRTRQPELFVFRHTFGDIVPSKTSRFVVEVPVGWTVETIGEAMDEAKEIKPTSVENTDGLVRSTWERSDVAARAHISRGLSARMQHDTVLLRLRSWVDGEGKTHEAPADARALSKLEHELAQKSAVRTPALEKTVAKALAGVPDEPRAKASRLYAWVRDNIRYCAISVGMGGFVPHEAGKAHDLRYGDCKDKANLLHTMLDIAGVKSRLATIYADDFPRRFRLPALAGNFNHMVLVVDLPEGSVVVDPTSRTTPFGDAPSVDEDRVLLPIAEGGADLMDAPASSAERDGYDERYELTFGDDGRARGTFSSSLRGELSDDTRRLLLSLPRNRHDDVIERMVGLVDPDVTGFAIENAPPPEEVTPVDVKGDISVRLVRGGLGKSDVLLRASHLFGAAFPSVDEESKDGPRVGPFLLGHRRTLRATVRLRLPSSLRVAQLPDEASLDSAWGSYRCKWTQDGADLVLERTVVWKERVVPAADVDRLRGFVATVLAADEAPVALALQERK